MIGQPNFQMSKPEHKVTDGPMPLFELCHGRATGPDYCLGNATQDDFVAFAQQNQIMLED